MIFHGLEKTKTHGTLSGKAAEEVPIMHHCRRVWAGSEEMCQRIGSLCSRPSVDPAPG